MQKMDRNAHSVYLLYYHLVMVVKYRRKVIDNQISERAKEIFSYIAPSYGIVPEEWNHDIDHVHVSLERSFLKPEFLPDDNRRSICRNDSKVYRKSG